MTNTVKNQKPYGYVVCINENCPHKNNCLKYYAYKHYCKNSYTISIVNPDKIDNMDDCMFFRSNEKKPIAYGIEPTVFDNIPHSKARQLRKKLHSHFGNTMYYRYKNGERPMNAEIQSYIRSAFAEIGYEDELKFTKINMEYDWTDVVVPSAE